MQDTLAKVMDLVKVVLLFILLTVLFYVLIVWIADYVEEQGAKKEPAGKSVQVMERLPGEAIENIGEMTRRLAFFYWFGE